MEGGNLYEWLHKKAPLSCAQKLKLMVDVAKALQFMHGKEVIHRDIKSANILVRYCTALTLAVKFGCNSRKAGRFQYCQESSIRR